MSWFVSSSACATVLPMMISVSADDDAIAEPQPNVWNFAAWMISVVGIDLQHQAQRVAA